MIIESDDRVFVLKDEGGYVVKAIPLKFSEDLLVITEDEYGETTTEQMPLKQVEEEYGPLPMPI